MFLAHLGHPEAADVKRRLKLNCSLHSIGFNGRRTALFGGGLRLPDGFCLVQEVGPFPQHICHLLTNWISLL